MRRESIPISTAASQLGPLGQGLGGSLLLILHYFGAKESIFSIMIIALSGITIAFLIFLRPQYRNILQSSLLKRQLNPSDFARILAGPEGEKIVSETLQSDNTEAVAFILTFLKEVNSTPFLPQIRKLVFSKSEEIAVLSLQLYRAVYRNRIFETISAQILGKDETLKARALDLLEISLNREDADRIIPLAAVLFPEEPSNEGTLSEQCCFPAETYGCIQLLNP